jgi:hypothetical protein
VDRRAANHVTQAANHASCCRGVVGEQPQNALQDVQSNGLGFPADGYFKRALALQVARRSRVATSRTCFRSPPRACGRILGAACTGGNNLRWWAMAGCREPPNARGMASTAYSTGTSLRARVSPTRASRARRARAFDQPFARKGQLPDAGQLSTLPLAVCPTQNQNQIYSLAGHYSTRRVRTLLINLSAREGQLPVTPAVNSASTVAPRCVPGCTYVPDADASRFCKKRGSAARLA